MTVSAAALVEAFRSNGVSFFTGVADSLLAPLNSEIDRLAGDAIHVAAANEGNAVAVAAGHHLATGEVPLVYMQNSGLGNAVNPLTSLAHANVYSIPTVLVIGWRGEPGRADEPQHRFQGAVTLPLLDLLEIPHWLLPEDETAMVETVWKAVRQAATENRAVAVVVRKGSMTDEEATAPNATHPHELTRGDVIRLVVDCLPSDAVIVATTGYTGRELAQIRRERNESGTRDVLVVGSMGHASSLALGVALGRPDTTVACIDGDGSFVMHMGAVASVGKVAPVNLVHVVVNNGVHESVGGQPTAATASDLAAIADAVGYRLAVRCRTASEVKTALGEAGVGPVLVEVTVRTGSPDNLLRPDDLDGRKHDLMESLRGE